MNFTHRLISTFFHLASTNRMFLPKYMRKTFTKTSLILISLILIASCSKNKLQPLCNSHSDGGVYQTSLKFKFDGYTFTNTFVFKNEDYNYYKAKSKKLSSIYEYKNYVLDDASHPYLNDIKSKLEEDAITMGYSGNKLADYIVAFAQGSIPYTNDPENNGLDYPKYPIETLLEYGGDCEDKAILATSLLQKFGFEAVLVHVPGHMMAAVNLNNGNGSYYEHNGKKYYCIEATQPYNSIGYINPDYYKVNASIIDLPIQRYSKTSTVKINNDQIEVYAKIPAKNLKVGDIIDLEIIAENKSEQDILINNHKFTQTLVGFYVYEPAALFKIKAKVKMIIKVSFSAKNEGINELHWKINDKKHTITFNVKPYYSGGLRR